jgi:hypothetical protein
MWPRAVRSEKKWEEFEHAPTRGSGQYIVMADITAFYDSIDHDRLVDRLIQLTGFRMEAELLGAFLGRVMGSSRGLPQGLAPSDMLATVALSSVDAAMVREGFDYVRHGDDMRLAVSDYGVARRGALLLERRLREVGLVLSGGKTRILRRDTYVRELAGISSMIDSVRQRLLRDRLSRLGADDDALVEELANREMEQLGWDLFYHERVTKDEVIEELRPYLEPRDVEVAEKLFRETMRNAPRRNGRLSREEFHQRLTASMTRLAAGRSLIAIRYVRELLDDYPDKTPLICSYLNALANVAAVRIARIVGEAISNSHFRTEWELAWLLRTLTQVHAHAAQDAVTRVGELLDEPHDRWLAAVEGAKLLARRGSLSRERLVRLWNTCPRVFHADLVLAAGTIAATGDEWAADFVRAAQDDPINVVVARHLG